MGENGALVGSQGWTGGFDSALLLARDPSKGMPFLRVRIEAWFNKSRKEKSPFWGSSYVERYR